MNIFFSGSGQGVYPPPLRGSTPKKVVCVFPHLCLKRKKNIYKMLSFMRNVNFYHQKYALGSNQKIINFQGALVSVDHREMNTRKVCQK